MNQQPLTLPEPPEVAPDRIYVMRRRHVSILMALISAMNVSLFVSSGRTLLVVRSVLAVIGLLTWVMVRRDRRRFEAERGISDSVLRFDPPPSQVAAPRQPRAGARKVAWILGALVVVWLGGDLLLW